MNVEIIVATPNPITVVSRAAGTSYGKDDFSKKRVETCIYKGHLSVLEHVCATWKISGISRSCTHQLVRHRLASYTEKSLRYTEPSMDNDDWYVIPYDILKNQDALFEYKRAMAILRDQYLIMKGVFNIKKEDARFLLPLATKTEITVTMNLREFLHFYYIRSAKDAQWEIRAMAEEMFDELRDASPDWKWLLETYCLSKGQQLCLAANSGLALAAQ